MQDVLHSQRRNQSAQLLRQARVAGTMMKESRKTAGRNLPHLQLARDTGQGMHLESIQSMPMQDVLHSQRRTQSAQLLRQAPVAGNMIKLFRQDRFGGTIGVMLRQAPQGGKALELCDTRREMPSTSGQPMNPPVRFRIITMREPLNLNRKHWKPKRNGTKCLSSVSSVGLQQRLSCVSLQSQS